jgi:hypothetical protein
VLVRLAAAVPALSAVRVSDRAALLLLLASLALFAMVLPSCTTKTTCPACETSCAPRRVRSCRQLVNVIDCECWALDGGGAMTLKPFPTVMRLEASCPVECSACGARWELRATGGTEAEALAALAVKIRQLGEDHVEALAANGWKHERAGCCPFSSVPSGTESTPLDRQDGRTETEGADVSANAAQDRQPPPWKPRT